MSDVVLPESRPIRVGLIVVTDTTAPEAAPAIPDEALKRLTEQLGQEFSQYLPFVVEKIIPAESLGPKGELAEMVELGRRSHVEHVLLVVLSSMEQEYPMSIFLGWTTHQQPGWRRDNWSLMEAALVDVVRSRVVLQAEGRGVATLDRPTAPGINQWYPVVWLRPQDPARRIFPPTYAGAPNTLRVVAMTQALRRLVPNFQDAWIQQRQRELSMAEGLGGG
jgi:hypothetical protein